MIFSTLSMMCLVSMALFLKKFLLTAIFTAAPQTVNPAS